MNPCEPISQKPSTPEKERVERKHQFLRQVSQAVDDSNQDTWTLLCKNWENLTSKGTELPEFVNAIFAKSKESNMDTFIRFCEENGPALKAACIPPSARKLTF